MNLRTIPKLVVTALLALTVAGCSKDTSTDTTARPTIVVTFPIIGAVVKEVVGDAAELVVLMPPGTDPHEWEPSAQDRAQLQRATLIVDNGLELETQAQEALDEAGSTGIKRFTVSEHVTIRKVKAGEGAEPDDPDQAPGAPDPHLWTDPITMAEWLPSFADTLGELGLDVKSKATDTANELRALNDRTNALLANITPEHRKLVTGHESMGYFAERYGLTLIGAVIPSLSSEADPAASDMATLTERIRSENVPAIFSEIGTPEATVAAIGSDTGAKVVQLSTHTLPPDGTYAAFLTELATAVASGLGAST